MQLQLHFVEDSRGLFPALCSAASHFVIPELNLVCFIMAVHVNVLGAAPVKKDANPVTPENLQLKIFSRN